MIEENTQHNLFLMVDHPEDIQVTQFIAVRKYLTGDSYVRMFNQSLSILAQDKDFTGNDLRVFLGLLDYISYEDNIIDVTQKELSSKLNIAESLISNGIKKLLDKGYLELVGKKGKQNIYRLNPYVGFKGRAKNIAGMCAKSAPIRPISPSESKE